MRATNAFALQSAVLKTIVKHDLGSEPADEHASATSFTLSPCSCTVVFGTRPSGCSSTAYSPWFLTFLL